MPSTRQVLYRKYFNHHYKSIRYCYYPHCIDGETEAQNGSVIYPQLESKRAGFESKQSGSRVRDLHSFALHSFLLILETEIDYGPICNIQIK